MKKILILALFLTAIIAVNGQSTPQYKFTQNSNAWIMYFGNHKFSDKWGIHLEVQLRRNDFLQNPQQLLLRPGINYHFNAQVMATVGYCFVETYPYGDFPVKVNYPENRFWEQIQVKNQLGKIEWVSRFRLEQRWSNLPVFNTSSATYEPGGPVYTNRFRLLNRVSIPLRGSTIQDKSFYVSAYDEFFLNFGKNVAANIFDQNRAYIAIGYKIPKLGRLELGYLYQNILKGDGIKIEQNHNLQVGLSATINYY